VETKPVSPHSEGEGRKKRKRDRESEEPPSDVKKEKKKLKKEKTPGTAYDPATDSLLYVPDASGAAGTVAIVPETTEKQKKKNKTSGHWASSVIEPTPSGGAADKLEQSRKRKPTNGDAVEANGDEGSSKKSRSKSKKRKKGETVEDERHPSTPVPEGDHSSRKRKKSKASVHPDPSDDPNLTEQSQKGSRPFPSLLSQTPRIPIIRSTRDSSDLRLLPIHLARNMEVQQSPSKLGDPQRLDSKGEDGRVIWVISPDQLSVPSGPGKACPDGCRILVQG